MLSSIAAFASSSFFARSFATASAFAAAASALAARSSARVSCAFNSLISFKCSELAGFAPATAAPRGCAPLFSALIAGAVGLRTGTVPRGDVFSAAPSLGVGGRFSFEAAGAFGGTLMRVKPALELRVRLVRACSTFGLSSTLGSLP